MRFSDLGTHSFFPDSLSALFNSMDRYRSIAHFADFQVRSIALKKTIGSLLLKSAKKLNRSQKNSGLLSLAVQFTQFKDTQLMKQRRQNRKDNNQALLCVVFN